MVGVRLSDRTAFSARAQSGPTVTCKPNVGAPIQGVVLLGRCRPARETACPVVRHFTRRGVPGSDCASIDPSSPIRGQGA